MSDVGEHISLQCNACSAPIIMEPEHLQCVKCSLKMLNHTIEPRLKSERLRRWRQFAYEFLILAIIFGIINYYFGLKVQLLMTMVYLLPAVLPLIGERLSKIF